MAYKEFCREMHVPLNSSNKSYTTDPNLPGSQKIKERNGSASHPRHRSKSESRNSGGIFEVNAVTVTCLAVSVLSVCIVASMAIRQR